MPEGSPPPEELIARDALFHELTGAFGHEDHGSLVVVAGPAGIGKSTLVRAAAAWAEREGIRVGWGVSGEFEGAPPMWPWHDAIRSLGGAPLEGSSAESNIDLDIANDRATVFGHITRWLAAASEAGPLVVVIEDIHSADPTSLELLAYLDKRPVPPGVTIVATTRLGNETIDALRSPRLVVPRFTPEDVRALAERMGHPVEGAAADDLARRTGGNPLFVRRLLEHIASGAPATPLPADIVALLRAQLDAMDKESQTILEALSVVGTTTTPLLATIADSADIGGRLRGDLAGFVGLDQDLVVFRHAMLREVIYDDLGTERRFELHGRAADALRDAGVGPTAVAHHLAHAAATRRTSEAAEAALAAARIERSTGALFSAAEHISLAISILREGGDELWLATARVEEAAVLGRIGRVADAEQRLQAVVAEHPILPPSLRRQLVREYVRLRWREEPNPSVLDARSLVEVTDVLIDPALGATDAAVHAIAMVGAAEIRGIERGDLEHAERAVAAADHTDDPELHAEAQLALRRALMVHPTELERRRTAAESALRAAREANDIELQDRARRLARCDALASGDRERALFLLADDESVSASAREHAALGHAGLAAIEGRWNDAEEILDEAAKELAALGLQAPALDFIRIAFDWDRGNLSNAVRELEPLLPAIADPALRGAVALGKALDGQHDVAMQLIDEALPMLQGDQPSLVWTLAAAMTAEAAAASDHPAVAELYALLLPFADQCGIAAAAEVPWVGSIDRMLGLLSLRMDLPAEAVTHLERSLTAHERMRAEPWTARSHAALAIALAQLGEQKRSAHHQTAADEIVARLEMGAGVAVIGRFPTDPVTQRPKEPAPAQRTATLRRDGESWRIAIGGQEAMVGATMGFEYLSTLIRSSGTDWHVLDLYATIGGVPVVVEGHGGEMLDDTARSAYQARHRDLTGDLEQATADADRGAMERIGDEMAMLEQEVLAAFGLGGRARTMDDPVERARVNVRRSISRAFDRIGDQLPDLADHLRRSVQTGRFCQYSPDPTAPLEWDLG